MAKKKNHNKKHKFKHAEPLAVVQVAGETSQVAEGVSGAVQKPRRGQTASARDFSYVAGDLRRILALAGILVAVQVVLWWVLTHSGFGNSVYGLFKV